jgi:DNA replication and repair protein RecF
VHRKLSGIEDKVLSIDYAPGLPVERQSADDQNWSRRFASALEKDHETDLRRGTTQSGPHRDDLQFRLGDMDLRRYGSQGQQRLAVLALKIALARWVQEATGEPPILLLDDALSELDATRRHFVLQQASSFPQSILTATDETFLHGVPAQVLQVHGGQVLSDAVSSA